MPRSPESKTCVVCSHVFTIAPEDFAFYEKIKVPPPTFCPPCRAERRLTFRNARSIYRRQCDLCHKQIVALYTEQASFPVYCNDCWWSDKWDAVDFGRVIDFSRPFLEQVYELTRAVPKIAINNTNSVNAEYTNFATENKDCYLVVSGWQNENVLYSTRMHHTKDSMDCYNVFESDLIYDSVDCSACYDLHSGQDCQKCTNGYFLFDCRNCYQCIACVGLRDKKLQFLNEPISEQKFCELIKKIKANRMFRAGIQEQFNALKASIPHRFAHIVKSQECTGDYLFESKNCLISFELRHCEDSKWFYTGGTNRDMVDITYADEAELCYELMSGHQNYDCKFSVVTWFSSNIEYSLNVMHSNNLFGCDGLRRKEFCILNKQYSEREYYELIKKIKEQMVRVPFTDTAGKQYPYGEFFPSEFSPFAYNETVAQELFPLMRESATQRGYRWQEIKQKTFQGTIDPEVLPERIQDINDDILQKVISCAHSGSCCEQCSMAFKIAPKELAFYRRMQLSVPLLCPNCRHYERFSRRNPAQLYHRACACDGVQAVDKVYKNVAGHPHLSLRCPNKFETTYAPDRPEIVYCEECYQAEVV